jgi:hypothetical protein
VTSSRPTCTSDGYATAAAAVVSLAIALVAAAVTGASVEALRSARADLARTQAEYGLAGAQTDAAITVASSKGGGRFLWTLQTVAGPAEALAEPEAPKLGLKAAASLDGATLDRFGVADPEALKARLSAIAGTGADPAAVGRADPSPVWRSCAASAISPLGLAPKLGLTKTAPPQTALGVFRGGEVWRIRLSMGGWVDDRLVRFTGSAGRPFAVIARRFHRGEGGGGCDALVER